MTSTHDPAAASPWGCRPLHPVAMIAREHPAQLDEPVGRILEHRQDRVALLDGQRDRVPITVDSLRDHRRGLERRNRTVANQARDQMPGVVIGHSDPVQAQLRHTSEATA